MNEKEIILKAINDTDISEKTKKILSIIIDLTMFDVKRTIYLLLENTDNTVAQQALDEELLENEEDISTEFIDFLIGEIKFVDKIKDTLNTENLKFDDYCLPEQ